MKKSIVKSSLALGAILALNACGGGSSSVATGDAYYLDSAVAGVNYKCGSVEGITDKDGKFTFEEGQSCTFYLGDVKLREMDASVLEDGKKIVEEDVQVATILQSLDVDGNPDNGIELTAEVVEAFSNALQAAETATLPQTATELAAVVATIESNETIEYDGHVVTQEEATAHLETTQLTVATEETKALLAGKTFYLAYIDEDVERIEKLEVNADATSLTWTVIKGGDDSGVDPVTIEGTSFFTGNEEHIIQGSQDQYLEVLTNNNLDRLYYSQADAEAYLDSLGGDAANALSDLIVGKTLYQNCDGNIESITFGTDGVLRFSDDSSTETYRIDGNTIYTNDGDGEKTHPLLESTDTYIKFDDGDGETTTFYFSEEDAKNAPADDCVDGGDIEVSNVTSGKVVFKDDNNNTIAVPSDAWIRITPSQYQEDGSWNGLRCHINSDGTFGDVCYISEDEDGIREAFSNSDTRYQVVVFKNHIEPDETHWNCGEDLYKSVGNDLLSDSWTNIDVLPEDYQDRSDETCND
jgi:hypothetical protein